MEQLSFQIPSVLSWLLESTIYISILICLIFIIKAFTKRKLPLWWSYCLWLLLLFRMLVPWGVETPVSIFNYFPTPPMNDSYLPYLMEHKVNIPFIQNDFETTTTGTTSTYTDPSNKTASELNSNHPVKNTNISNYGLSFDKIFLILWFAGVLSFGITTVFKNYEFWLLIRREEPITDRDILELFDECKAIAGFE